MRVSTGPGCVKPTVVILGTLILFSYGVVALISQEPRWFLNRTEVPDPRRIVIRVDGVETTLAPSEPGYETVVVAARQALSGFTSWGLGSMGLSDQTLDEYQRQGTVLELYFSEPVRFLLPFNDGNPTALLFPVRGRYGGEGHVFRGKNGRWWAGQLTMQDSSPLREALSTLGYLEP